MNSPKTPGTPKTPRTPINSPKNLSTEVRNIRHTLNPLHKPWAISGSMAMKIHANSFGVKVYRDPNDIDIIVRSKDFGLFVSALGNIGYKIDGPPPVRYGNHLKLSKGRHSIDLLRSGSNLAPNLSQMNINIFNGKTPVIKVKKLINQKRKILNNIPNERAKKNINFLYKLVI
jgi:hypothetical protein